MAYEPINGITPVPKKRGFNKKILLVSLLLASITAAAITVIVLFTTNVFVTTVQADSGASIALGLVAERYDNQTTRLNGGVACEDFAADAKNTGSARNFKVLSYKDGSDTIVGANADSSYDAALQTTRLVTPVSVQYYGQTQDWNTVGSRYLCGLTVQKYDQGNDEFVEAAVGEKQSLSANPTIFPIDNVQISQPSDVSKRIFKTDADVAGFYDFLFNYFNHGPEIMELTTISLDPLPIGSSTLGDYSAPARSLQIRLSEAELGLLDRPPVKVSSASNKEWLLARRVNAIWPVLSHEYGHHLVEIYAKRLPVNNDYKIIPGTISYVAGGVDANCSSNTPTLKMNSLNETQVFRCDSPLFIYNLMDGVLSKSGYSALSIVKKVNFGTAAPLSETFANAKDFPVDYSTAFPRTSFAYVLSNTVWKRGQIVTGLLLNSYRLSYDEIMARLYNLASAPAMNFLHTSRNDTTITATNFDEEYRLHKEINTAEFPQTKPMISPSETDQLRLQEVGKLFEQMRASGAPISYIGASRIVDRVPSSRTIYGTSPNGEKYMLLRDIFGNYSTVHLDYGINGTYKSTATTLPVLKLDNSMQLVEQNGTSTHGTELAGYEWDRSPLTYKSSTVYPKMFAKDKNNEKTFVASMSAAASNAMLGKTLVGFTNTRITTPVSSAPADTVTLNFAASDYAGAFYQPVSASSRFLIGTNATGNVKRLTGISGSNLTYQLYRDLFSARVDATLKTITFTNARWQYL